MLSRIIRGFSQEVDEDSTTDEHLAAEEDGHEDPPEDEEDEGELEWRVIAKVVVRVVLVNPGGVST